jgi:peptide/nickel transport system substrate-binding protein
VIKHIRWQILLVLVGVGLLVALLVYVALNFTTVWVPSRGGTYVEGLAGTPQFINPLLCQTYEADRDLCALVFNGLTRMQHDGKVEEDLAEDWDVSPDGLTYTFYLRPGVRWQDGTLFTAADVVFTIELLQDSNYPGRPDWGELWRTVTVTEIDARTVQFELAQPFAPFLDYTTIGILPRHVLQGVSTSELLNHPFNLQPVGTGIYSVSEIVTDDSTEPSSRAQAEGLAEATGRISHVILQANPFYFRPKPLITRIQFKFYPSYQTVYQAYLDGEVQGIGRVAPENLADAQANPDLQLFTSTLPQYSLIYLNLTSETAPFLAEREVRQALLYALDRQALIDQVLDGQAIVAHSPVLPDSWAYDPTIPIYEYDREKAVDLLEEAGWQAAGVTASPAVSVTTTLTPTVGAWLKEGRSLSFSLLVPDDPLRVAIAQEIAQQWALAGIRVNVEPVATGLLAERLKPRHYQAALADLNLTPGGDPDPYPFWHQAQIEPPGQNYAGYDDRDMSEILETARLTPDREARKELYYEFQQLFAQDVPAILLYHPVYTYAVDHYVYGVHVGPIVRPGDRFLGVADWYVNLRRVIRSDAAAQGLEPGVP